MLLTQQFETTFFLALYFKSPYRFSIDNPKVRCKKNPNRFLRRREKEKKMGAAEGKGERERKRSMKWLKLNFIIMHEGGTWRSLQLLQFWVSAQILHYHLTLLHKPTAQVLLGDMNRNIKILLLAHLTRIVRHMQHIVAYLCILLKTNKCISQSSYINLAI